MSLAVKKTHEHNHAMMRSKYPTLAFMSKASQIFIMFKKWVLIFMLTVAPAFATEGEMPYFPYESFNLSNGMEVVVIPDHRTPVVTHMVWYKVGGADDPKGSSGIAHFLEHLMFKGTTNHPGTEFQNAISKRGGRENAFTGQDYTSYYQRIAKEHLETMMSYEADRMRGLVLTDDVVNPERDVVLEERSMRTDNDPYMQLWEEVSATLYQNHPYGTPIIGWKSEIEQLNKEKALAAYKKYYSPNNAILIVAGDVTKAQVQPLAEKTYGKIPANDALEQRVRPQEPPHRAEKRIVLEDARVKDEKIIRYYMPPAYGKSNPEETTTLDIVSYLLGEGQNSFLYKKLVKEKGIATQISLWYDGMGLDYGRMAIVATPKSGVSLEQLESALDETIAQFLKTTFTEDEITRAKIKLVSEATYARDSQFELARIVGSARTTGVSLQELQGYLGRVNASKLEKWQEILERVLSKNNRVTGFLKMKS